MLAWLNLHLIAEATNGQQPSGNLLTLLFPFIAIGFFFWFLLIRPQQKQRAQHANMLANLRKDDHVVTIGGIYGVVTNIRREADEVTLRVDEATGAKLRLSLGAIARVLREPSAEQPTEQRK